VPHVLLCAALCRSVPLCAGFSVTGFFFPGQNVFVGNKIRMDSGVLRVARGGFGAKAPPLAARPVVDSIPSKPRELKIP